VPASRDDDLPPEAEGDESMTRTKRSPAQLTGLGLGAALALAACGRAALTSAPPGDGSECILNEQGTECLPVAPEGERVDLAVPVFSDPSSVTNPLHPTATTPSILLLGTVDDLPFRTEVTLLPKTKIIEWNGQQIEALVSQYAAFSDGRILEVALDWYAQADDGSVWYLGEDVFNYEDGVVADTHGTWIAGQDGPGAMIMPADPRVGDVYRPENAPGVVFEEVTVQSVDETVEGPRGPVTGAIVVRELHMDGSTEDKIFAPGYGEFSTGGGGDLEAVALAVPIDALAGPVPAELETLTSGAGRAMPPKPKLGGPLLQSRYRSLAPPGRSVPHDRRGHARCAAGPNERCGPKIPPRPRRPRSGWSSPLLTCSCATVPQSRSIWLASSCGPVSWPWM
jgi:hypothetical protein